MPLDPTIVQDVLANIQSDIEGGFDGILAPKNGFGFIFFAFQCHAGGCLSGDQAGIGEAIGIDQHVLLVGWKYVLIRIQNVSQKGSGFF